MHAFIGKESYTNFSTAYSVRGFVSIPLRKKLSGLVAGGVWEWFGRFIESVYSTANSEDETDPPMKPTLEGNVMVIFYILIAGLTVSTCSFIVEVRKKLMKSSSPKLSCFTIGKFCIRISGFDESINLTLKSIR